jgi:exopolysaccharide biosynthesis protein
MVPSLLRVALLAAATLPLAGAYAPPPVKMIPRSSLAVRSRGSWNTFWRSDAPGNVAGSATNSIAWRQGAPGTRWAELELKGNGEAWRTKVVLVRIDPAQVHLELANGVSPGGYDATWSLSRAPSNALVALNAGQFSGGAAWGWVVHEGVEYRAPGKGPLAAAVVIDSSGAVNLLDDAALEGRRTPAGNFIAGVAEAFQSYPILLREGEIPGALLVPGNAIDLAHRDARLALGQMADGTLLIALTRFDALGGTLGSIPFGLTIPETAGLLKYLGCEEAVALDGGLSAQLLVQDSLGERHEWPGLRRVPLALVALPRP